MSGVFDVLVALTPLILGLLITGVGAAFTHVYNFRQLQLNQINALEKLRPLLVSDKPDEREFAYSCFVALGYASMAVRIIALKQDASGRRVLEQLESTGPAALRAEVRAALRALDEAVRLVDRFERGADARGGAGAEEQIGPWAVECQTLTGQLGIRSKLGQAILLDTLVHSGEVGRKLIEQTAAALPRTSADAGDEEPWLRELLRRRRERYRNSRVRAIVEDRVAELERQLDEGRWDL
jgi:Glycosyl hydrolase family 46